MLERYETQRGIVTDFNELYGKLHEEIINFRDSVHDILLEMSPVKEFLI